MLTVLKPFKNETIFFLTALFNICVNKTKSAEKPKKSDINFQDVKKFFAAKTTLRLVTMSLN